MHDDVMFFTQILMSYVWGQGLKTDLSKHPIIKYQIQSWYEEVK